MERRLRGLAILLLALAWTPAFAQGHRASIRGVVIGPSGEPMRDVGVLVANEQTGAAARVKTDDRGRLSVAEVPPGVYRITVEHAGYGRFVARTELAMGQDYWLNVTLQRGDVLQAMDVVAPFLPADHDTPALHTLITDRDLNEWPIGSGSFLELALLAPDTAASPEGSPSTRHGLIGVNVAGARDDANTFLLDGVEVTDPGANGAAVRPPTGGIRQFQVFTSNYDASFGHTSGGQISVVTKSGSNRFAGSAYELARVGGRTHFAPTNEPAPEYNRNQFGGSAGGPIVRNRAFFFADFEHTRLREGITRVTNVPTVAERGGDFSHATFNRPLDFFTGLPFPGDLIPIVRRTPLGLSAISLYPLPNRDAAFLNFVSSPVRRDDLDQFGVRFDQMIATGSRLTARYSLNDRTLFEPFSPGGSLVPGFGTVYPLQGHHFGVSLTHAPASTLANDFRFGYTHTSQERTPEGFTTFGLTRVSGYSTIGRGDDLRERRADGWQIADTATLSLGHSLLKGGVEWYGVKQRTLRESVGPAYFTFVDRYTGNALADLFLGLAAPSISPRVEPIQRLQSHRVGVFVQNDWRPSPSFSLSAGVRYDYATPPVDPRNAPYLYDQSSRRLVRVGSEGMPRGGYVADTNNIAPRVGVTWTVGADRMHVIRAAYGVYHNQEPLAASDPLFLNPVSYILAPPVPLVFNPLPAAAYQRDLQTPRMDRWTVNVQRQMGQSRAFELGYTGSRGRNLLALRDINQAEPNPRPRVRPDLLFADITMVESRASSDYNALHVRFQQRPATGTSMIASYTLGKSMDDASGLYATAGDPNFPQNSLDPRAERARSSFDVRHRFSGAITRPLPFNEGQLLGKLGFISRALADTDLVAVATFQSGRPFTVSLLPTVDNSNTGLSVFGFGGNDRPNVSGSAALKRGSESAWFNTSVFSVPAFGTFGNSGRNAQTGPGYKSVDVGLVRHIRPGIRTTIDLRLEIFNLLGTVNYDLPDAFLGSPTFGRLLSAGSPRRVQFGVRAAF